MQSYNLSEINVLILESNSLIRRLMTNVFREFGVSKGRSTDNADKAYELFAATEADIIISDWAPELDGISFIERVRNDPDSPNPYVPIIVCSGNTERRQVLAARDAGMSEYLAKPVSPKSIYSRICSVVENERVFVRNGKFFGPDRRRRDVPVEVDRRMNAVTA
ncbi:MAG: response regulator [Rhodospirillales bacterium]|nr:response regulator [Rhodospirillales bacterium]